MHSLGTRRAVQGLVALVIAIVPFVVTVPSAFASTSISVTPSFPGSVTVGQTAVPGSMQIQNGSTGTDATANITVTSITYVPACGTLNPTASNDCPAANADPGVFTVNPTVTGQAGTACAGMNFSVTTIDAATGEVQFTPTSGMVMLAPPSAGASSGCTVLFSVNVNKEPTHPSGGSGNSLQTNVIAAAAATSALTGGSSSAFGSSSVNVNKAQLSLTTVATSTVPVGSTVFDTATLGAASPPGPAPTGTITFNAYGPLNLICAAPAAFTSSPITVAGTGNYTSPPFTPTAAGTYEWEAVYSGDAANASITTACGAVGETTTVTKATPTISTTASAPTTVGGTISDSAILSGGFAPTGNLVFQFYGPNNPTCASPAIFTSTATVAGNGVYPSTSFITTNSGTYNFVVSYSGDANNAAVTGVCGSPNETTIVTKVTPTVVTTPSGSVTVGGAISDTAALSGGVAPTGTLTFDVYGPNNVTCTGTPVFMPGITVTGNGNYSSGNFTPAAAGIYEFVVIYSGDSANNPVTTTCGAESVTVTASVSQFTAVTPARDLDTRNGTGGTTGPIHGNTTFNLTVAGVNGVPATGVGAVALNVTVTSTTCAAWVTVFPAGQPVPASSNLNYTAGETIANSVVVGVGTSGQVSFNVPAACAGQVQIIADVQGWYAAQTGTPPPGSYTPLTPARDLDTRNGTGGTTGPVHGNTTFNLTVAGVHGVPATGAGAVALNVTVTNPTCAAWVTVFPAGQPVPASSNLNYTAGETIANLVVVGVGTSGQVSFNVPSACAGSVQVIADVQGWYATQSGTPLLGSYTPLTPGRDLDTRNGTGGTTGPIHGNSTFSVTVTGVHGVPATGVSAVVLNVTVTNPTCAAFLTVFPAGQPVPGSSNINYTAGETIANLVIVGVGASGQVSFNVPAACAGSIQVIADVQGWYAN